MTGVLNWRNHFCMDSGDGYRGRGGPPCPRCAGGRALADEARRLAERLTRRRAGARETRRSRTHSDRPCQGSTERAYRRAVATTRWCRTRRPGPSGTSCIGTRDRHRTTAHGLNHNERDNCGSSRMHLKRGFQHPPEPDQREQRDGAGERTAPPPRRPRTSPARSRCRRSPRVSSLEHPGSVRCSHTP
jgi:hypothetical protein